MAIPCATGCTVVWRGGGLDAKGAPSSRVGCGGNWKLQKNMDAVKSREFCNVGRNSVAHCIRVEMLGVPRRPHLPHIVCRRLLELNCAKTGMLLPGFDLREAV